MVCCINCFNDTEIRAAIEMIGHRGNCPVCKKQIHGYMIRLRMRIKQM